MLLFALNINGEIIAECLSPSAIETYRDNLFIPIPHTSIIVPIFVDATNFTVVLN